MMIRHIPYLSLFLVSWKTLTDSKKDIYRKFIIILPLKIFKVNTIIDFNIYEHSFLFEISSLFNLLSHIIIKLIVMKVNYYFLKVLH